MERASTSANAAAARRPLLGLLVAQFLCTFVDNAWKLVIALLAVRSLPEAAAGDARALESAQQHAFSVALAVFTLPIVLVSVPAALVADRVSKRTILVSAMSALVVLLAAGTALLFVRPDGGTWKYVLLALAGVQAALFSPAKYGILPELLPHERLSEGNGQLELYTFLAIVSGTAAAGPLLALLPQPWMSAFLLTLLAAAGAAAARRIPKVPAAAAPAGARDTIGGAWAAIRGDRVLGLAVVGSVAFWGLATLLAQTLQVDAKSRLGLSDAWAGVPLAVLAIGVGAGSALAGKLSARKVEYGLLPLGALLLSAFSIALGAIGPGRLGTGAAMVALGLASGLLLVPLDALIQWRAPESRRGAVIALSNAFVFAGVCAGALFAALGERLGLKTRGLFVAAGVAMLGGAVWATSLAPQAFVRLVLFLLTHTFYRLRVAGREHVPHKGGALLVPNHVSFVDGLLVLASLDRPVRFVVEASYFERPIAGRALRWIEAIPISSAGGPRVILRALRDAGRHLDEGHLVCIFPEGQITRTGALNPFRRGMERIAKGRAAPIVPVHLDGVWGSIFSFAGGRFVSKLPERLPYRVTASFGAPLPSSTPLHDVRRAVEELGEEAWRTRKAGRRPLHHSFLRQVRRRPWRLLFADANAPGLSRLRAAAGAIALARALRDRLGADERVGILLPPSIGGALANLAVAFAGRASVNLNYTAGRAAMSSAAAQAGLRNVLTSVEFLAKAKVELPEGVAPVFVEEALRSTPRGERAKAALLALLAPARLVEKACGAPRRVAVDDVATVIFSSGSTGEPKGVLLTHFNLDSNVEALAQAFRTTPDDRILGVLPLFHSFGLTATLWFPACMGLASAFHPSPIDAAAIGELVERHRVTFLLATPTLLSIWLRRCTPAQFGSLRLVLAGAEKLSERLAEEFENHFGIRPLEGYGATECAPVIAANTFGFRAPGFYQPGWRRGTVGRPLPGVAVRVVDAETFKALPPGAQGLLLVKGPNVMQGYLGRPELTASALRDGWYVTGDLGSVDEDGFVRIADRLARFSKIGGEMVPHGRVEDELHKAAGATIPTFAVTALPDPKKGERLAVVHTLEPERIPDVLFKLAAAGLPNLFLPRADAFVKVDALPQLGTGKLDLRAIRRIAEQALGAGATES